MSLPLSEGMSAPSSCLEQNLNCFGICTTTTVFPHLYVKPGYLVQLGRYFRCGGAHVGPFLLMQHQHVAVFPLSSGKGRSRAATRANSLCSQVVFKVVCNLEVARGHGQAKAEEGQRTEEPRHASKLCRLISGECPLLYFAEADEVNCHRGNCLLSISVPARVFRHLQNVLLSPGVTHT